MRRFVLLASLLGMAWCVMLVTHESGHVVCGWLGGGTLVSAELRPWHLPHSHFRPDPHPIVSLWGGPLLGVAVPLLFATLTRWQWAWFVSHFCTLANGLYIATSWWAGDALLDTPRLLDAGASRLSIAAFCVATIPWGYIGLRNHIMCLLRQSNISNARA